MRFLELFVTVFSSSESTDVTYSSNYYILLVAKAYLKVLSHVNFVIHQQYLQRSGQTGCSHASPETQPH